MSGVNCSAMSDRPVIDEATVGGLPTVSAPTDSHRSQ